MIYNHKATGRLEIRLNINGKNTYLGLVDTQEEGLAMIAGAKKVLSIAG